MVKISIFTPSYNRAYTISNLYESLLKQSSKNFEWIIVNDGSTDNLDELVEKWMNDPSRNFEIIYLKEKNEGKQVSINKGVLRARGELFFIVDSDDHLTNNAVELILERSLTISKDKFAGLAFCRGYDQNTIIGKTFDGFSKDATSLERSKFNIMGDKAEVFYTDILKKYPFPQFPNENFVTEATVWYKIANDNYKIRWYQDIIYICNYLEDGLTADKKLGARNFKGYTFSTKEILKYNLPLIDKTKMLGSYVNAGRMNNVSYKNLSKNVNVKLYFVYSAYLLFKLKYLVLNAKKTFNKVG